MVPSFGGGSSKEKGIMKRQQGEILLCCQNIQVPPFDHSSASLLFHHFFRAKRELGKVSFMCAPSASTILQLLLRTTMYVLHSRSRARSNHYASGIARERERGFSPTFFFEGKMRSERDDAAENSWKSRPRQRLRRRRSSER